MAGLVPSLWLGGVAWRPLSISEGSQLAGVSWQAENSDMENQKADDRAWQKKRLVARQAGVA